MTQLPRALYGALGTTLMTNWFGFGLPCGRFGTVTNQVLLAVVMPTTLAMVISCPVTRPWLRLVTSTGPLGLMGVMVVMPPTGSNNRGVVMAPGRLGRSRVLERPL